MDPVYRDNTEVAHSRRDELAREYFNQLAHLDPRLVTMYARRQARTVFGIIAALGGVAMFAVALSNGVGRWFWVPKGGSGASMILVNTWAFAILGYIMARILAPHYARHALAESAAATDDVFIDIARFDSVPVTHRLIEMGRRTEVKSILWPLVGLALIGPLSMHAVVAMVISNFTCTFEDFDGWIRMSAILVGHCHIVLAYYGWQFARDARKVPTNAKVLSRANWQKAFWVIAWSIFPGGLFILPVGIVAVTGIVYILVIYGLMAYLVEQERDVFYARPTPQ